MNPTKNSTNASPLLHCTQQNLDEPDVLAEKAFNWSGRPAVGTRLGGRRTFIFVHGNICLWYVACFGIYFNMVLLFTNVFHQGSASAASNTTDWFGSMFLCAFAGALVAESRLGRLWTCAAFQILNLLGMALFAFSTSLFTSGLMSSRFVTLFYVSIYLIALATGAYQPTLQALGADQLDTDEDKSVFFSRYLVISNFGMACADTLVVYAVNTFGYAFGFWICTGAGAFGLLLFLSGIPLYRQYRNHANPYFRAFQVLLAAVRNWHVQVPKESNLLYEMSDKEASLQRRSKLLHSESLRWLDKAAIISSSDPAKDGLRDTWTLCTVTQVEEVKCVLRMLPIWVSSIFYNTVYAQAGTMFVEQGTTMNCRLGSVSMQPATMNLFNIVTLVLIFPPIYYSLVVPLSQRFTGLPRGLTPLQRTGVGYVVCLVALVIAAIVEMERLMMVKDEGLEQDSSIPVSMSIFWLIPQYVLLGAANYLVGIGQLEFFYSQAPDSLRSLGSSLCLTCIALGAYASSIIVTVVAEVTTRNGSPGWIPKNLNEGHLDYFYWLMAVLTVINFIIFVRCARSFRQMKRYKQESPDYSEVVEHEVI